MDMFMKLSKAFPTYEIHSTGGGFWLACKQFKAVDGKYIQVELHENGANVYALVDGDLKPTEFGSAEEIENDSEIEQNWIELHSMSGYRDDLVVEPMFDEETLKLILTESKRFLKIFWGDEEYYTLFPDEKSHVCERCHITEGETTEYNRITINYEDGIILNFTKPKHLCDECYEEIETKVFTSVNEPWS
jgi:hypothetical protein